MLETFAPGTGGGEPRREVGDVGLDLVEVGFEPRLPLGVAAVLRPLIRPTPRPRGVQLGQPLVPDRVVCCFLEELDQGGRLLLEPKLQQIQRALTFPLGTRGVPGATGFQDGVGVGGTHRSQKRIAFRRGALLDLGGERAGDVVEFATGQCAVVGGGDGTGLPGHLFDFVDALRSRTPGTDRVEFPDQLVAAGEQFGHPGELTVELYQSAELHRPGTGGVHRYVHLGQDRLDACDGVQYTEVVGDQAHRRGVGRRPAVHQILSRQLFDRLLLGRLPEATAPLTTRIEVVGSFLEHQRVTGVRAGRLDRVGADPLVAFGRVVDHLGQRRHPVPQVRRLAREQPLRHLL